MQVLVPMFVTLLLTGPVVAAEPGGNIRDHRNRATDVNDIVAQNNGGRTIRDHRRPRTGAVVGGKVQLPASSVLSVVSLDVVNRDPTKCRLFWAATLSNSGTKEAGSSVTVQAFQSDSGGNRAAASGTSAPSIQPGRTGMTNPISFHRKPNMTELEINLFESGRVLSKKVFSLPVDPPPKIDFGNTRIGATSYLLDVRNLNAEGVSDITIQGHSSESQSGPWSPAGGRSVECIEGNETNRLAINRPLSDAFLRLTVSQDGVVVAEGIFSRSDGKRPGSRERAPTLKEGMKLQRR